MAKLNDLKLWWYFFLYTFCISAMIQIVLLPYVFPSLHAGNGLLSSSFDSMGFHQIAIDLANKIRIQGWSVWQLRPGGQSPSGIASIFYFFILPDPRILIPITSALHASAALILLKFVDLLLKNKAKSILCVLPFLIFPSNLQWTAQWHRDGFSILGVLLILQAMLLLSQMASYKAKNWIFTNFVSICSFLGGFFLIWLSRPYMLKLINSFVVLFFLLLFFIILIRFIKKEIQWKNALLVLMSMAFILLVICQTKTFCDNTSFIVNAPPSEAKKPTLTVEDDDNVIESAPVVIAEVTPAAIPEDKKSALLIEAHKKIVADIPKDEHWENLTWLPSFINNNAYSLSQTRRGFRLSGGKSIVDSNIGFGNFNDLLIYLPRAAQIVFLAPFPNQWMRDGSSSANTLMRRISAFEMIIVYFFLLFLPKAIWHWRKRIEIWVISIFCIYIMLVHGLVICNVGTLYRMKYVYIMILVALGVAGFIVLLDQLKSKKMVS